MKTLSLIVLTLMTLSASFARAQELPRDPQSILRLDSNHAYGDSCSLDVVCFDGLLGEQQVGVMIEADGQMSFVTDVDGEPLRVYLQKAADCPSSDSDPEGAREFFIDMKTGVWHDEAAPVQGVCRADSLS